MEGGKTAETESWFNKNTEVRNENDSEPESATFQ
jgi:hypothetical protein